MTFALMTFVFSGNVEAGLVGNYVPFQCYVDRQINTYNNPGDRQRAGWISANVDLIRVTQIRSDGWAYGDYPGSNGKRVSRWFRLSDICADPNYPNRNANVKGAQQVFRTSSSTNIIGSVSNNESVIVLADNGNRAQILYRLDNGTGYKVGWVPSSTVAASRNVNPAPNNMNHNPQGSVEQANSPAPNTLHVRGKAYDLDNARGSTRLHVYVGGGAGSGAPSYEIRTDGNSGIFDDMRTVERTGRQRVYVYALNDYGAGENKEIWNGYVDIQGQSTPNGLLFPLKGNITVTTSSAKTNGHYCDYVASEGTPIYAPFDGTVTFRQSYAVNYGKLASYGNNFVFTSSDGQYKIVCAHLSSFNGVYCQYKESLSYPCGSKKYTCKTIILGQKNVHKGELIGYTGMTGNASGPHIHIEVYKNGTAVNPKNIFTAW